MLIYSSADHFKMECSKSELEILMDLLALRAEIEVRIMKNAIKHATHADEFHVMDLNHDQVDMINSTCSLIMQHCSDEQLSKYECVFVAMAGLTNVL